jgi:hypothetical protein
MRMEERSPLHKGINSLSKRLVSIRKVSNRQLISRFDQSLPIKFEPMDILQWDTTSSFGMRIDWTLLVTPSEEG